MRRYDRNSLRERRRLSPSGLHPTFEHAAHAREESEADTRSLLFPMSASTNRSF